MAPDPTLEKDKDQKGDASEKGRLKSEAREGLDENLWDDSEVEKTPEDGASPIDLDEGSKRSDEPEDSRKFLAKDSQVFKTLKPEDRFRLLEAGQRVSFEAGEEILTEGKKGETFYLLENGEVEVSTRIEGKRVTLARLSRGLVFGEVPVFSNKPRTAMVTALGKVEVLRFKNSDLTDILDTQPDVREELQTLVLDRARVTIEKIVGKRKR